MRNAMIINAKDNVIVAVEKINRGEKVIYVLDGKEETMTANEDIPIYHKIARCDIAKGSHVIKYGEYIGEAGSEIKAGDHVHTHNVLSVREKIVD